jgi:hypothetical protein
VVVVLTIAAGPRQRSHSRVRVLRDSLYFTASDSRLPPPGGPGPRIYIPHEQGGPVIPTGTGFLFVASYYSQGTVEVFDPKAKVKVKVTLRLAIYRQSVRLGMKPLETHDQSFFFQLNP